MWNPSEIRKLIAQIAGFGFGAAGVWLLISGVRATGSLNITSSALSGKIESGSAGLFLIFLGFFLILFPAIFGKNVHLPKVQESPDSLFKNNERIGQISQPKKYVIANLAFIVFALLLLFGGNYVDTRLEMGVGQALVLAGIGLGVIGGIMLVFGLITWVDPTAFDDSKKSSKENT